MQNDLMAAVKLNMHYASKHGTKAQPGLMQIAPDIDLTRLTG